MESDQTSDADKTEKTLDSSHNNPDGPTTSLEHDKKEEIGDLVSHVQDVSMTISESDKGSEDPGKSDLMSKLRDIVKTFFETSPDKIKVNQEEKELVSKLDFSFSLVKASDYGPRSNPGDSSPTSTMEINALQHFYESTDITSADYMEACLEMARYKAKNSKTGDVKAKPAAPIKKPIPKPMGVTVCDPRYPTPYFNKYRKLDRIGSEIPDDIRKKALEECTLLEKVLELQKRKHRFETELASRNAGVGLIQNTLQPAFAVNPSSSGLLMTVKDIVENVVTSEMLKPADQEKTNPFDMEQPLPPEDDEDLVIYCDKEFLDVEVYPEPPAPDSLDEGDDDDESLLSLSEDDEPQGSDSLADFLSSGYDDDEGDPHPGIDPSLDGRKCKKILMVESCESKKDDQGETDDDSPKYVLNEVPLKSNYVAHTFSSAHESDFGSPVLKKTTPTRHDDGKSGPVRKSLFPEAYATRAGKEARVESKELGGVKRLATDIMESPRKRKISEETVSPEVTHSKDGIPVSFSNPDILAWVKGKMSFAPKNLQQLEDEVIKSLSSMQVSSSNSDILNGKEVEKITQEVKSSSEMETYMEVSNEEPKKPPVERKHEGKPMDTDDSKSILKYLMGSKRQVEDNLRHLQRLINHVELNLESAKGYLMKEAEDPMDTGHSTGKDTDDNKKDATGRDTNVNEKDGKERDVHDDEKDATDGKKIEDSKEIDSKSPCLEKKLTGSSGKENRKRDSKSKFPVDRRTSPLSDLNQAFQQSIGKRSLSISPSTIDEQKTKTRKTFHRKSQTP